MMMYAEPVNIKPKRPNSWDDVIEHTQEWSDSCVDFQDCQAKKVQLGLDKEKVAVFPRDSEEDRFFLTRQGMVTLLRLMRMPSSLATLFDSPKNSDDRYEQAAKAEHVINFLNGLLRDCDLTFVVRVRDGNIRAFCKESAFIVDYVTALKKTALAYKKLGYTETSKMFREFDITDDVVVLSVATHKADLDFDDTLRPGFKLIFSETDFLRNDVVGYVYRQVCKNGLMAEDETVSRFLPKRALKSNFYKTMKFGISKALESSSLLVQGATRLRNFPLNFNRKKTNEEDAKQTIINDNLPGRVGLPTKYRNEVVSSWLQQEPNAYGLMNSITATARTKRGFERHRLEGVGGQLAFLPDNRLKKLLTV
jgi:hypothetical protein